MTVEQIKALALDGIAHAPDMLQVIHMLEAEQAQVEYLTQQVAELTAQLMNKEQQ